MTILAPITTRGEFRQITIEPMVVMRGDVLQIVGSQLLIIRDNTVIATYDLTTNSEVASTEILVPELISKLIFFKERAVPGQSQVIQSVSRPNSETDEVSFNFADGNSIIYPSWETAKQELSVLDSSPEFAQKILMYKSIVNSPDGTNMTTLVGVQCAVNFQAAVPIALIEP